MKGPGVLLLALRRLLGRENRYGLHRARTPEQIRWAAGLGDHLEGVLTDALTSEAARASLAAAERRVEVSRKVPTRPQEAIDA